MKQKYLSHILLLMIVCLSAQAQVQIQNSGTELWNGPSLQKPDNWSTTEQAFGIQTNKWVFKESRPDNVHSGASSIRLFSDTIIMTYGGKPSQTRLWPGIIAYGKVSYVNNRLSTTGLPIYGRPVSLSMYVKVYHPQADTASMRLVLTRWNYATKRPDTLANERRDIFSDSTIMSGFALFVDSIKYLMDGEADTARIVISGGRPGSVKLRGNTVWIDDLTLTYPSDQIVHPDIDDRIFLYPNPASNRLTVKANADMFGYSVIFMDVSGLKVKEATIDDGSTVIDVSDLHSGSYCYAVVNHEQKKVQEGNINIMRNR